MSGSDVDDLLGKTVAGRFRILRRIGQGGMGAVYVAEDALGDSAAATLDGDDDAAPAPRGRVALKVIKQNLVEEPEAIARFQREARAVGALKHPHIVGFVAAGDDDGLLWLAMELLDGTDLKERIASRGAMPWKETLPLLQQMLLGLQAAHERGVVHRDLKPENVMLVGKPGASPVVKLLDFGIAKQIDTEGMTMTGTGVVVGTPGFVAPEVIVHGVTNDPRSDLYSLGVVWFEMLTATKPFDAPTPFALALRHVQEPPPRPSTLLPFSPVPVPVEDLLLRLLAKKPEERPSSAAELIALLDRLVEQAAHPPEPSTSRLRTATDLHNDAKTETSLAMVTDPGASADTLRDLPRVAAPAAASSRVVIGAAAVVVAVVVGAVVVVKGGGNVVVVDAGVVVAAHDAGAAVVDAGAVVVEVADAGVAAKPVRPVKPVEKPVDKPIEKPVDKHTHKPVLDLTP